MKNLDDIKREAWQVLVDADNVGPNAIDLIIDHLHAKGLLMVWNTDMDSAPRDGTEFLAYCPHAVKRKYHVCHLWYYRGDVYRWEDSRCHRVEPTAWMPLPRVDGGGE